jgi:hypothetical protein
MHVYSKYIPPEQQKLLEFIYNNGKEFDRNKLFNYTNKRSLTNAINILVKKGYLFKKAILTTDGIKYKYLLTDFGMTYVQGYILNESWFLNMLKKFVDNHG